MGRRVRGADVWPRSPQVACPPGIADGLAELVGAGEDCLTLSIWTPDLSSPEPPMVWIAGGMFEFRATGGSAFYDGAAELAEPGTLAE